MTEKFLTYEQSLKLPYMSTIFSESKRYHYCIVYNYGKLVVRKIRSDNKLESNTIELTKDEIESNFYHPSTREYIK